MHEQWRQVMKGKNTFATTKICVFSPPFLPFASFGIFSFPSPTPPPPSPALPVSFGGRYYVIVGGIEHRSRGSSGPMNYWWESRRDPPRPAHFTSSSPHSRVNQAKGRERGREGERKRGGVHCFVGGHCLPPSPAELWMERQLCSNQCWISPVLSGNQPKSCHTRCFFILHLYLLHHVNFLLLLLVNSNAFRGCFIYQNEAVEHGALKIIK